MIQVKDLTKRYGKKLALDGISFELNKGEIVGLLGPNGAGKSTTMNIITGYLSADSGNVLIDGHDILEQPDEAKKLIGYLPEIPPLYPDMTVKGYLEFMFGLKKVKKPKREHIEEICEMVDIGDVKDRIIKHLSKGYRQRVGLAQALLGDPPVLILDEPTVGLDPVQIAMIRKLIGELGKKHTIILSSHLLSEVQAVCDKIIVISEGQIKASDFTAALTATGRDTRRIRLAAEGRENNIYSLLRGIDNVTEVEKLGEKEKGCYEFIVSSKTDIRRSLYRTLSRSDCCIMLLQPEQKSLEETYLRIISGSEA